MDYILCTCKSNGYGRQKIRRNTEAFEVKIIENNPTTPQIWRVFLDREFTAKLRVIKKDADTGMTVLIPNTEFKIFNMDTNEYVEMITTYPSKETHTSFFTDGDGDLILPDVLPLGNYRIEEVAAPYGYVINDEYVTVMVDTDTFYEIDPDTYEAIITVDYVDEPAVGELWKALYQTASLSWLTYLMWISIPKCFMQVWK